MDVQKLKGAIVAGGYTQATLAKELGIQPDTMYKKMKRGVFNTDEALKMIEILNIDNPVEIFLPEK